MAENKFVIPHEEFNLEGMLETFLKNVKTLGLGRRDISLELHKLADLIVEKERKNA